ncbi:hypothetical protein [Natrialba swarupiae]|uniref:DUF8125 domain-containing protein n=1 Tax=Natrialba swarupiae TaxID=2448032 RepID=A0A5D5AJ35_9EURY|nr:hypothetical protein [Natrialba swarupiae]TYT61799.1 hypothetical protein FYC77_11175 [Natrialba swarupiae]
MSRFDDVDVREPQYYIDEARRWLDNNRRVALVAGAVIAIAWWRGYLTLPPWWTIGVIAAAAAALVGWLTGKRTYEELNEENGVLLVDFTANEPGGAIWELSEDRFADLEVSGTLHQWDQSTRRVYEVRDYDPNTNVAIANWRESEPGSALARERTVEDVFAAIRELREDLEPDAAKGRELQRRIRGIVRQIDRERAEAQQRALDEHIAPDVGDSRTISDIVDESLPDDLHPERCMDDDDETENPHPDAGGGLGAVSVTELGGPHDALEPLATDGGQPDE